MLTISICSNFQGLFRIRNRGKKLSSVDLLIESQCWNQGAFDIEPADVGKVRPFLHPLQLPFERLGVQEGPQVTSFNFLAKPEAAHSLQQQGRQIVLTDLGDLKALRNEWAIHRNNEVASIQDVIKHFISTFCRPVASNLATPKKAIHPDVRATQKSISTLAVLSAFEWETYLQRY